MNNNLSLLGLCKKAGKLIIGFDVVMESVKQKKAYIVVLTKDISNKTLKEVSFVCNKFQMEFVQIDVTLDEIWFVLGKRAGVFSVTDKGLAEKFLKLN